jgi:hypothetical protein
MSQPTQPGGDQPQGQPQWQQPPGYPPPAYPPQGYGQGYPGYGPPPGYGSPPGYGPPPGHVGWAVVALLFFWPLAIPAFISYSKIDSTFYRGDVAGAQRASQDVKRYGVIALVVGIAFVVVFIVFSVAVFSSARVM